ncbi:hypothetical protein BDW74DRAFT_177188 [Aspergillus multicolor]|uniref:uncharacterized protein n=1 Tax=Aspergillus multicolor TaxID=41759 RepID=UPI003CCD929D
MAEYYNVPKDFQLSKRQKPGPKIDRWKGKVADLSEPPYRKAKMEGKLPGPHPDDHEPPDQPKKKDKRRARRMNLFPDRWCLSPEQVSDFAAPIHIQGAELGLPEPKGDLYLGPTARSEGILASRLPKIYIGDDSPTPRWLIRPVHSEIGGGPSRRLTSHSTTSTCTRLPPLGRLRWEFDPGPAAKHQQDETQLRNYAYRYLQNSLCDPIVREELRDMIWDSEYAPIVEHVEDPLPVPPPPPHFRNQRPSDFVNIREPISSSDPDNYHFMYADYARPSLAGRSYGNTRSKGRKSSVDSQSSDDSHGSSSTGESSRTRSSTNSGISVTHKEYSEEYQHEIDDDTHHYLKPGSEEQNKKRKRTQSPSEPPKRGRGTGQQQKRRAATSTDTQTSDESIDSEPPRKKRRYSTRSAREPTSETSSDEYLPPSRQSKKESKKRCAETSSDNQTSDEKFTSKPQKKKRATGKDTRSVRKPTSEISSDEDMLVPGRAEKAPKKKAANARVRARPTRGRK